MNIVELGINRKPPDATHPRWHASVVIETNNKRVTFWLTEENEAALQEHVGRLRRALYVCDDITVEWKTEQEVVGERGAAQQEG